MNPHNYGLILAGGRGTRFWPRSRKRSAKQVLDVAGERSLIQATDLAAHILRSLDPDAVMGVFPSDHVVEKPARYRAVLKAALKAAAAGNLMVVGIQPRWEIGRAAASST